MSTLKNVPPNKNVPSNFTWGPKTIKSLRQCAGISQSDLANLIGVRQQTISEWETDAYRPRGASIRMLNMVAEKYNFDFNANSEVFKQTTTNQKNYSSVMNGKKPYKLSKPIGLNGSNRTSDYYRENGNGNETNEEALWWKTFKQSNVHRSFTSKEYPM